MIFARPGGFAGRRVLAGLRASGVTHEPEFAREAEFAVPPPLATPAAARAEFADDGDPATLTARALVTRD